MKLKSLLVALIVIIAVCPRELSAKSATTHEGVSYSLSELDFSPGELIIKANPRIMTDSRALAKFTELHKHFGAYSVVKAFPDSSDIQQTPLALIYLARFPQNTNIPALAEQYKQSPLVEDAQPNYLRHTLSEPIIPNDPEYEELWSLEITHMPEAWAIEKGSPDVAIAIVDMGIDYNHEDLKSKVWINEDEIPDNGIDDDNNGYVDDVRGWDFSDAPTLPGRGDYTERDNDPMDETGHGTHVAGIAGAEVNNGIGVAGVAWNCKLMALRAGFPVAGGGTFLQDDDVSAAIVYAADNGATSINMSWGDMFNAFIIRDALNYAYNKGCVLVAATGNETKRRVLYPAALRNVIAVAASDQNGEIAFWSNASATVDIAAPGNSILSTHINNKYRRLTGTSMAAPQIAGVAALMRSKRPELSNKEIRQLMVATAIHLPNSPKAVDAGQVHAAKALTASASLIARINVPESHSGGDKFIDIIGSAGGYKFAGYRLFYGESTTPNAWIPMPTSAGDRVEYTTQRLHEKLETWHTAAVREGIYTIRLETVDTNNNVIRDEVVVVIDHSPPKITDVKAELWLNKVHYTTAITWDADEPIFGDVYFRLDFLAEGGNQDTDYRQIGGLAPFALLNTGFVSEKQLLFLSNGVSSGNYQYYIVSHNAAGLETIDDNNGAHYRAEVVGDTVTPNGFRNVIASLVSAGTKPSQNLPAMHIATATADFDGDGRLEIVGMETGGAGYQNVKIFERDDAGNYELVFTSPNAYFPWAVGDTDGDGLLEILGNTPERTFLLECRPGRVYPRHKIWETQDIWGGQIVDVDQDGKMEIIGRNNDSNAISIYEADFGDNSYQLVAQLENPTKGRNGLGTTFAISDFDGDGWIEIMAGDEEGDLFIYENIGDNQFRLTWQSQLIVTEAQEDEETSPVQSAYHLAANDLDGDGRAEFIVGGKADDSNYSFIRRRWIYKIFTSDGDDSYHPVWAQGIRGIRSGGNGVTTGDVDGDGQNEVMIVAWPNLYIFKYDGHTVVGGVHPPTPIWHHTVISTFNPIIADINGNGVGELLFNEESSSGESFSIYELDTAPEAPLTPWNVIAIPLDESSVYLAWEASDNRWRGVAPPDASREASGGTTPLHQDVVSYIVYRGTSVDHLEPIARDIQQMEYIDKSVEKNITYWYAVAAQTATGTETKRSEPVSAKPGTPPKLVSAEYFHPNRVILHFDKTMGASSQDPSRYSAQVEQGGILGTGLDGKTGTIVQNHPSSALLDQGKKRVILAFDAGTLLPGQTYNLVVSRIWDTDRIAIPPFSMQQFTVPPEEPPTIFTDLSKAIVYPNPVRPNEHHAGKVFFANLPTDASISIYSITGELIEQLTVTAADQGKKEWYLLNNAAAELASGIYIYVLESNGQRKTGKLAVIR